MSVFLLVVFMCLWLIALVALAIRAMDAWDVHGPRRGSIYAMSTIALFALPFGVAASWAGSDPYARTLCLRGHQEWQRTTRSTMIVGKTIMPGGSSTHKVWVCDQWEAR